MSRVHGGCFFFFLIFYLVQVSLAIQVLGFRFMVVSRRWQATDSRSEGAAKAVAKSEPQLTVYAKKGRKARSVFRVVSFFSSFGWTVV